MKIVSEITEDIKTQIVYHTQNDNLIRKLDLKRFADINAVNERLKRKDRTIYALLDDDNKLMGIAWFGIKEDKELKDYPYTFAIRMYAQARGKGLALNFMKEVFKMYTKKLGKSKLGFWLETDESNAPALKLYSNFGFSKFKTVGGRVKMLMLYTLK